MSDPLDPSPAQRHPPVVRAIERAIFASRWLLAPLYLGLAASLLLLLGKFAQQVVAMVRDLPHEGNDTLIIGVLSLVDLSLMSNLVLIVMFAGYENFVSRFDEVNAIDKPDWMGHVGFGGLKLKLLTSIVAISAIHLLEDFMHVDQVDNRELGWGVGIHVTFVVSGVLLALMDMMDRRR